MTEQDWRQRISIDPRTCHGKPCVKGTRVLVSLIVQFLANDAKQYRRLRVV